MSLLIFLACATPSIGVATATTIPVEEEYASPDRHGTLAETTQTLQQVQRELEGLSAERLVEAHAAAAVAIRNCPYNRSAVQVPLVMSRVLARHDAPELEGVKASLALHLEVLEALEVSALVLPVEGDYLRADMPGIFTGPQLAAHEDPVAGAMLLVLQIQELVDAYPPETTARIDAALETVNAVTLNHWELKGPLLVYRNQLEWILAQDTLKPEAAADVQATLSLIAEFVQLRC